jgi:hypothetical protein
MFLIAMHIIPPFFAPAHMAWRTDVTGIEYRLGRTDFLEFLGMEDSAMREDGGGFVYEEYIFAEYDMNTTYILVHAACRYFHTKLVISVW